MKAHLVNHSLDGVLVLRREVAIDIDLPQQLTDPSIDPTHGTLLVALLFLLATEDAAVEVKHLLGSR